jgi:hypothetical protein
MFVSSGQYALLLMFNAFITPIQRIPYGVPVQNSIEMICCIWELWLRVLRKKRQEELAQLCAMMMSTERAILIGV